MLTYVSCVYVHIFTSLPFVSGVRFTFLHDVVNIHLCHVFGLECLFLHLKIRVIELHYFEFR